MKFVLMCIMVAILSGLSFAQDNSIEKEFLQNKAKLKLERYSIGEDASSGSDYLVYKDKTGIVKIRDIWSSTANDTPRVHDFYYRDGKLILFVAFSPDKKQVKNLIKGKDLTLNTVEKLSLTDSKLTDWIENGKAVSNDDARWHEKEKEVLEAAKYQLENYQENKKSDK